MNKNRNAIHADVSQTRARRSTFYRKPVSVAVASIFCFPVFAQEVPTAKKDKAEPETVVVTGIRASLSKAQDIKRNSDQILDAIVADDIGKLPDANVAEALQRISGVQISRNRGEGDRVQVRGLSQTQTLLNGRSIFTAGKERGLSFQDIPAELLAGVNVYKTPAADQVEGGIGGIIDLRTRRPFDFAGRKLAATVKETQGDYVKKNNTDASFLVSDRWNTSAGEFGALLSVAHQKRDYRSDTMELGAPAQLADRSGIYAPTGVWTAYELGNRDRTGISAAFQYRPNKDLEFYADVDYAHLKTKTDTYGFFGSPFWANFNSATNLGQLFKNGDLTVSGNSLQSGKLWGASMSTTSATGDNDTRTRQLALGSSWKSGDWKLKTEVSHTKSDFSRLYQELRLGAWTNSGSYAYDMSTPVPSAYPVLGNADDLSKTSQYWADRAVYFKQVNDGRETVWKADIQKALDIGPLTQFRSGVRYSDRNANSAEINTLNNIFSKNPSARISGATAALDAQIGMIPYNNLLSRAGTGQFPVQWMGLTDLNWLRSTATARAAIGLNVPDADAHQTFAYKEQNLAWYGMADFETQLSGKNTSGNFGVRLVNTKIDRSFTQLDAAGNALSKLSSDDNYVLPSLNVRTDLSDKLVARFAASKVLTMPNFDQLTPSLSLNANDKTGYLGNPKLKALTANQLDVSLEYYLNSSDHVYGAAFYKKVDGFIQTSTKNLSYSDGNTYTVSTPVNGEDGKIKGLEVGYQAFFKQLPGILKGLGVQANYTYVESAAPGVLAGQKTALEGLSRNSYNIIGMYDYADFSFRLAYNYRDKYLTGSQNYYPVNGTVIAQTPVYMQGYGVLDAYFSYAITPRMKVAFEASNLNRSVRRSYYGVNQQPKGVYVDDRRFAISLHMDM